MASDVVTSPLSLAAITLATLGAILLLAGIAALVRGRALRFGLRTLTGLLLLSVGGLAGRDVPLPGWGAAGGPLRPAPALQFPRSTARRRVRRRDVRAGAPTRRVRAARLGERPADTRRAAHVELEGP